MGKRRIDVDKYNIQRRLFEEYNRMFPGIVALENQVVNNVMATGYVRMLGGRKRRLWSADNLGVDDIKRVFVNSLIQGSAAVVLKLAMVALTEQYW